VLLGSHREGSRQDLLFPSSGGWGISACACVLARSANLPRPARAYQRRALKCWAAFLFSERGPSHGRFQNQKGARPSSEADGFVRCVPVTAGSGAEFAVEPSSRPSGLLQPKRHINRALFDNQEFLTRLRVFEPLVPLPLFFKSPTRIIGITEHHAPRIIQLGLPRLSILLKHSRNCPYNADDQSNYEQEFQAHLRK